MEVLEFRIHESNPSRLVEYIKKRISFRYENEGNGFHVLIREDYYLRSNSFQLNIIFLKMEDESLKLDIIAGGAGHGLLKLDFGAEKDFLNKIEEILNGYSDQYGLEIEKCSTHPSP